MKMAKKEPVPTPNEIWKILREVSVSQKETDRRIKENEQLLRKSRQETDRRIKENEQLLRKSRQETDRRIKENDLLIKQIESRWGNQWGKLIEALLQGSLIELLNQQGIKATKVIPCYRGQLKNEIQEYDLIAINGKEIVIVETKSHLNQIKVDDFLTIIREFKKYCPEFKALTVYGGMAFLRCSKKVWDYAENQGLFVIQVSGNDNASLMNKKGFKPKVFC